MKRDFAHFGKLSAAVSMLAFAHRFVPRPWNVDPAELFELNERRANNPRRRHGRKRHKTWYRSARGARKRELREAANATIREQQREAAHHMAYLAGLPERTFYHEFGSLQREAN